MTRACRAALVAIVLAGCGGAMQTRAPDARVSGAEPEQSRVQAHRPSEEEQLEAELAGPADRERTPFALLRLATLRAGRAAARWEPGDGWTSDGERAEQAASIGLLQRVVREFPRSSHVADALLFLGELERARGADEAALRAWLAIVCVERAPDPLAGSPGNLAGERALDGCTARTTDSALRGHAWVRIAELAFDATPGLDLGVAIEAYRRTLEQAGTSAELRTIARYKRAWALYRSDRFAEAITDFAAVAIDDDARTDLRAESIQYMAISIAEKDWDADGRDDPVAGLDRPEIARFIEPTFARAADVLRMTAQVWFDMTEYAQALGAYDRLIARFAPAVTAEDRVRRDRAAERAPAARARDGARARSAR